MRPTRTGDDREPSRFARPAWVACAYAAAGTAWIVLTDLAVHVFVPELEDQAAAQTIKGLAYIAVTTLLVWWLARLVHAGAAGRAAAAEAAALEQRMTRLLDHLGDVVCVVNANNRRIVRCNEAVRNVLGWDPDELVGHATEVLHPDRAAFERFARHGEPALHEHGVFRTAWRLRRRDGSAMDAEITVLVMDPDHGMDGNVITIIRDVSERSSLEAQLRQSQKMESLGTLAGGVAHEINNPLTAIQGTAELMIDDVDEASGMLPGLERIRDEAGRIHGIVRDLLGFARANDDSAMQPAGVDTLIERTVTLTRASLDRDGVRLTTDVPDDLDPVLCNERGLQQVLLNLINNARHALDEAHPNGGGDKVLRISARPAERDAGDGVRITVEDNGTGIRPEHLDRIFDPFFTTKTPEHGTGLGLAVSYGIVRECGGDMTVESEPGSHTRFHIHLPAAGNGGAAGDGT